MEDTNAGIPPVETGSGVETISSEAPAEKTVAELLAEKDAEIAQAHNETANYRRAALKAKGKLPEDDEEEEDTLDAIIDRKVEEKLHNKRVAEIQAEKDTILNKALKENEEMRNALRNRPHSASSAGSNADKPEVMSHYFSPEQEADLKARGLDPATVLKNMAKAGQQGAPTA